MTETTKAIGLRLPLPLWEALKEYGLTNFPADTSKEGFEVTRAISTLLAGALNVSLDKKQNPTIITLDPSVMARLEVIEQKLTSTEGRVDAIELRLSNPTIR